MTPAPGLGFSRDKNTVTLRMTIEDWCALLMLMGAGTAKENLALPAALALVNRLNAGNPDWTPYAEDAAP